MNRHKIKKYVACILIAIMLFSTVPAVYASQVFTDIEAHWAKSQITDWVGKGLIKGYSDGSFKPDNNITRAEFMAMVNRAFGYEKKDIVTFKDVPTGAWYYEEMAKARAAGYISGYEDGTIRPDNPITRAEAAAIIMQIKGLAANPGTAEKFTDASEIPIWSRGAVGAVAAAKIMNGYPDGSFKAGNTITRAEAVVALNRALGSTETMTVTYDKAGVYGPAEGTVTVKGSVIIKAEGVTLQNTIIERDLTIDKAVGEGDVTLKNLTLKGTAYINGGGANSVHLIDTNLAKAVVLKTNGSVRIVASGNAEVGQLVAQSSVKVEEANLSGKGFIDLVVEKKVEGKIEVNLAGVKVANLEIKTVEVALSADKNTEIKTLEVKAGDVNVTTEKGTTITTLVADGKVSVTGQGTIQKAVVNVSGVSFETKPQSQEVATGVTPPTVGTGTTGGSSGGGTTTVPVSAISVTPAAMALTVRETGTITAAVSPDNATNKTVTWTSSDEGVATVANGVVTAVTEGTATITVTTVDGGKTAICTVTVKAPQPQTEIDLEIIIADKQEIWVSVRDKASDELILGVTKEDFSLSDAFGNAVEFKFNDPELRDPDVPEHEYLLSPAEGIFTGEYTLTFTKAGYQAVSKQINIVTYEDIPVGASIQSVAATNGTVTITLAAKPTVAPVESDFTATSKIGEADATDLALTGFNYNGDVTVTYTFTPIVQTAEEQSVVVAVKLGEGEPVAAEPFTVAAKEKITPVADTAVSATAVTAGQALSNSTLSGTFKDPETGTAVEGTLAWTDATTVVTATGDFAWTFTRNDTTTYNVVTGTVSVTASPVAGGFTPGQGGALPTFTPFVADSNKIGGLYVERNQRVRAPLFSSIRSNIDMKFLPPSEFGATGYTLQYSDDGGSMWADYDVATISDSQDNISLEGIGGNYKYRLLVNGGASNGYTSNEVDADLSNVNAMYSGWGLEESLWISGTMVPFVGRGLKASFTVTKFGETVGDPDVTFTDEHMTYQWYRVNPVSYELTEISGATNLTYITTEADVGYELLIRATGDGVNVGGYAQVMSHWDTVLQNNSYISNISGTGFTLNLYKTVDGLGISDLSLTDKNGAPVTITGVTQGANGAIYNISATLDPANGPFYLRNNSGFWRITSSVAEGHMISEGVEVPYSVDRYNITVADVVGGTATVYTSPGAEAAEGETVTVNISNIESGKQFKSITVTDADSGAVETTAVTAGASYTFTMPAKAVTVTIEVEEIPVTNPEGALLDADAGTDFIGVLYARDGNIYYNQADASGTWGSETLIGAGTEGRMAVDSTGKPHVVYTTSGKIGYRMYDGSDWTEEVLIESNYGGICSKPDIAVDSSRYAHITYTDTKGNTGDYTDQPDIMYANNTSGTFVKELIFKGFLEYYGGADRYAEYFNKGSHITVDSSVNYFITARKYQYQTWFGGNDKQYSIAVKSNLGSGGTTTSSSDIFDNYDLASNGNKVVALYKQTGFKTSELTVSGTTINFTNTKDITGTSVSSVNTDGNNIVVGGTNSTKLQTNYNGIPQTFSDIVVSGNAVSIVHLNGNFYAVYTDNADGKIKMQLIEATYAVNVASVVGGAAEVTVDKTTAAAGETVTVTIANIESGKQFKSITVVDADSQVVTVTEVTAGQEYTFTMPAKAVTVTVEVADTTAPELQAAAVDGATLTLTYDEALDESSVPDAADFTVNVNSSSVDVSGVAVSGDTVTLTLADAVNAGDTVTVSYTAGINPIQDVAGNDAANLTDQSVNNNTQ